MSEQQVISKLMSILTEFAAEVETGTEVEEGDHPYDRSDRLINESGWATFRDAIIEIMEDEEYARLWEATINLVYSGMPDEDVLEDSNYFIALMYACLQRHPGENYHQYENTVWSVVIRLKKVGYNSDYDPLQDPQIKPIYESILSRSN